jgi:adenylate cyclase
MARSKVKSPAAKPAKVDVSKVVDWLMDGARSVKLPQDVLQGIVDGLTEGGIPLHRAAVFVTTLHPSVMGRAFLWREGDPEVRVLEASHDIRQTDVYVGSPVAKVFEDGKEIRRKLEEPDCPIDFAILADLRKEGVTDYLAQPLEFTNGQVHAATWTTRRPGGFSKTDLKGLRQVQVALSRVAEIYALKRTAVNLLNAYLGEQAGAKVLAGQIKRGDGAEVHAVIWFCDLRRSTPLADSMSRAEFLTVLNEYFECMAGAVLDQKGEVLRFIGDAVLAVFPVGEEGGALKQACRTALAAAKDAIKRMKALNRRRRTAGKPELGFGIGLHLGDVMYGNIGTPNRIEFTVIGAAANEAARIESLTKTLGVEFLMSDSVVQQLRGKFRSLGKHALRGVGQKIELFTLR